MKNWLWLVLASLVLMTGCAQGYTDSRPELTRLRPP